MLNGFLFHLFYYTGFLVEGDAVPENVGIALSVQTLDILLFFYLLYCQLCTLFHILFTLCHL